MENTTTTLAQILTYVGTILASVVDWLGDIAEVIVSTPLFQIGVGLFLIGAAVSFVRRLLSVA